jgi:hypothetical protein
LWPKDGNFCAETLAGHGQSPVNLCAICYARASEAALNDNNVLKFERRKPEPENKPKAPGPKKGLIWLAVIAVIALVWAYYQFLAPQAL